MKWDLEGEAEGGGIANMVGDSPKYRRQPGRTNDPLTRTEEFCKKTEGRVKSGK